MMQEEQTGYIKMQEVHANVTSTVWCNIEVPFSESKIGTTRAYFEV